MWCHFRSNLCTSAESVSLSLSRFCCHQAETGVSASVPVMSHCFFLPSEFVIGTGGRLLARMPRRALKRQHSIFTLASVNPAVLEVRSG